MKKTVSGEVISIDRWPDRNTVTLRVSPDDIFHPLLECGIRVEVSKEKAPPPKEEWGIDSRCGDPYPLALGGCPIFHTNPFEPVKK